MADDDNFDIDIYGDDSAQNYPESNAQDAAQADTVVTHTEPHVGESTNAPSGGISDLAAPEIKRESSSGATNGDPHHENATQQISSTGGSMSSRVPVHKQAPQQQGTKRKQGEDDDRPMDPGATAALVINDLNWWISEEDIRGWANQSGCEDEVNEITFNEHKVNGKSKG